MTAKSTPATRGLFEVYIVDSQTDQVRKVDAVVADNKAAVLVTIHNLPAVKQEPERYDIIIRFIGSVRANAQLPKDERLRRLGLRPA